MTSPWATQEDVADLITRIRAYLHETGYTVEEADRALAVAAGSISDLIHREQYGRLRERRLRQALDLGFDRLHHTFDEATARTALNAYITDRRRRLGEQE